MVSYTLTITHEFSVARSFLSSQVIRESLIKAPQTYTRRILLLVIANLRTTPDTSDGKLFGSLQTFPQHPYLLAQL